MLVQRVLNFMHTLNKEEEPAFCDAPLYERLCDYFNTRPAADTLHREDIQFLLSCFKTRWESIVDTDQDYTLNPTPVNLLWIEFARELESVAMQNYLKILIPTLTNERDLNDLSPLNETVNLFNFYLGHDGTTLYRKLSFCKHLDHQHFALSTYRDHTERQLSVVTVDELARLKRCKQTQRQVSIGSESFDNFWDLMRKKVFVHLSDHGQIPLSLLPHLVELIERYYFLRSNEINLRQFKQEVNHLFNRLYSYPIEEVNFLYGALIDSKNTDHYVLDVFIDLDIATDFSDYELPIQMLSKWLYQLNPLLKASSKELASIYDEMALRKDADQVLKKQSSALDKCCSLLVSLMTTSFESKTFSKSRTFSLWDKSNTIPLELSSIFNTLIPFVVANRPEALAGAYDQVLLYIINSAKSDESWMTWFTRSESIIQWRFLVEEGRINELGAYWFEPELLFFSLLRCNTNSQALKTRIKQFLDDLIQTYAQDQNDLMKKCRINILFSEFVMGLQEHHRLNLVRLITLYDPQTAKSEFLSLCSSYINERLSQLSNGYLQTRSPQFFSPLSKLDVAKLFNLPEEVRDISSMIAAYKIQLLALKLEPKIEEQFSSYLLKLGHPILTEAQKEEISNDDHPFYMGQYI